jgi:hypothetical protein
MIDRRFPDVRHLAGLAAMDGAPATVPRGRLLPEMAK